MEVEAREKVTLYAESRQSFSYRWSKCQCTLLFCTVCLLIVFESSGVGKSDAQILVLGATNIPWELDAAIRRRFEKRIYIPLPEPEARAYMVKLNLGDTPNELEEDDFERLGDLTEGASGSDIKVLVKEALMEPLRKCQQARQFVVDDAGNYLPCENYPNCPNCLSSITAEGTPCRECGAVRMQLWDVPSDLLKAPLVQRGDFERVMKHSCSTVSEDELKRFHEWTKLFGQDGS